MNRSFPCRLLVLILAAWATSLFARNVSLSQRVLRDGSASTRSWSGSDKELVLDGGAVQTVVWLEFPSASTFHADSLDLDLFVKSVGQSGTLSVYALNAPIEATENGTQLRDLSIDQSNPIAKAAFTAGTTERLVSIHLAKSADKIPFGIVLASDDGLYAKIAAKESDVPAQLSSILSIPDSLLAGIAGPRGPQGPMGYQGVPGDLGPKGEIGPQGPVGAAGPKGDRGDAGAAGEKGETGAAGPQGPAGPMGLTGTTGPKGDVGAAGPKGDNGLQGPAGQQGLIGASGPRGVSGATWLSGAANPLSADGLDGDHFLNSVTDSVFQKVSGQWVAIAHLRGAKGDVGAVGPQGPVGLKGEVGPQGLPGVAGPKGEAGAAGAQGPVGPTGLTGSVGATGPRGVPGATWLSGTANPLSADGLDGDHFLNSVTDSVFQKVSGQWVAIAHLRGAKGDVGAAGPQGPVGLKGEVGPQGLPGVAGPKGDKGETGTPGVTGPKGDVGATGPKGEAGTAGAQGPVGPTGPIGLTGSVGATGPRGVPGATWFSGAANPLSTDGFDGDHYLNSVTDSVFEKASGQWVAIALLRGAKGDVGATGPQGLPGVAGPKGDIGIQGPIGPQGAVGLRGGVGATGPQGPVGATGAVGATGPKGDAGDPGFRRIVVVPALGGNSANGDSLLAALASITTASETTPYLLHLEPGTFDLGARSLALSAWIDVEGSGVGRTVLLGSVNGSQDNSGLVSLRNLSTTGSPKVRALTIKNTASGLVIGVSASDSKLDLDGIEVSVVGTASSKEVGIQSVGTGSLTLARSQVNAAGGDSAFGILANTPQMSLEDVKVRADHAAALAAGLVTRPGTSLRQKFGIEASFFTASAAGSSSAAGWKALGGGSGSNLHGRIRSSEFLTVDSGTTGALLGLWTVDPGAGASAYADTLSADASAFAGRTADVFVDGTAWLVRLGASRIEAGQVLTDHQGGINLVRSYTGSYAPAADASIRSTLDADPSNCGGPGVACPVRPNATATCASRQCGFTCSSGFGNCDANVGNGCETNTATSLTNCGTCGNACAPVANAIPACISGQCGFLACNAGFSDCDGNRPNGCETNTMTSLANCGMCGNVCGTGKTCRSGACDWLNPCQPTGQPIPPNGTTCEGRGTCQAGTCVVPQGAAGLSCYAANQCISGVCGSDNICGYVNGMGSCTFANATNNCRSRVCGSDNLCGYANGSGPCTSASGSTVCRSGACSINGTCMAVGGCGADGDCTSGHYCSSGSCVALLGIGSDCSAANQCASSYCVAGKCSATAPPQCSGPLTSCNGQCFNLQTNFSNCGVCGNACSAGQTCNAGACQIVPCQADGSFSAAGTTCGPFRICDGSGLCVSNGSCAIESDCAPGQFCSSSQTCLAKLGIGSDCSAANQCASSYCVAGKCSATAEIQCSAPLTRCGLDHCFNLFTDASNCGTCGNICGVGQACNNGACQTLACHEANGAFSAMGTVCQGGVCDGNGSCVGCLVDANCGSGKACVGHSCVEVFQLCAGDGDCTPGQACFSGTCGPKLANGAAMGTCTPANGARFCTSGVCGSDNLCGLANGSGACSQGNAATLCRSGKCSASSLTCVAQ